MRFEEDGQIFSNTLLLCQGYSPSQYRSYNQVLFSYAAKPERIPKALSKSRFVNSSSDEYHLSTLLDRRAVLFASRTVFGIQDFKNFSYSLYQLQRTIRNRDTPLRSVNFKFW